MDLAVRNKDTAFAGWIKSCCHPVIIKASCDGQDYQHTHPGQEGVDRDQQRDQDLGYNLGDAAWRRG